MYFFVLDVRCYSNSYLDFNYRFLQHFKDAFQKYINIIYGLNQKATLSILLIQDEQVEVIIKPSQFMITKFYETLNNLNFQGQVNPFSDKSHEPGIHSIILIIQAKD